MVFRSVLRWVRRSDELDCSQVGRVLQGFLDSEIDETTAVKVERHLEACRRCGLEAETYTELKRALARRGGPVDPAALGRLEEFGHSVASGQIPVDEDA